MRRGRPRTGTDHALRRLPPEAARVRVGRSQDPSLRSGWSSSHRDAGPVAADVVRPEPRRNAMIDAITARAPGFKPKVALVLGSGLGDFAAEVKTVATIPSAELPDFPQTSVASHAGKLVLGHIGPTPVAVLQGRGHYYEHG